MAHTTRQWTTYNVSNTAALAMTSCSIKCDATTAANNTSPYFTPGVGPYWPLHPASLRAVYGVDNSGVKDHCVCTSPAIALYQIGSGFADYEGNNYIVNALRVERFRVKELK